MSVIRKRKVASSLGAPTPLGGIWRAVGLAGSDLSNGVAPFETLRDSLVPIVDGKRLKGVPG